MSTTFLPPVFAGICLAGVMAAIMSTASAQLLVASSALANDLYRSLWRRDASRLELLWIGRIAVLMIAVLAMWLARNPENTVLSLVAWAWAGFGAAFGPVVILSLYWKAMTRAGAFAGILVGGVTVVVWKQLVSLGGIFELYELVPGFVLSMIAIVVVSRLTGARQA
jgi:sodium/proline symporter